MRKRRFSRSGGSSGSVRSSGAGRDHVPWRDRSLRRSGFTLLEVVAALVLLGVLAALFLPVWDSGLRTTLESADRMEAAAALRQEMEEWVSVVPQLYRGASFGDLRADVEAAFAARMDIELVAAEPMRLEPDGTTLRLEPAVPGEPYDVLLVTLRDTAHGMTLTRLFTRKP